MPQVQARSEVTPAPLRIETPAATRFLLDPEARTLLLPFYGPGATVSEAAAWLGQPLNRVLKQVYALEGLGLLHVREVMERQGRPMKRYGVTSTDFFVPFTATSAATLEDLLMKAVEEPHRLVARALPRLLETVGPVGYLVSRQEDGRMAHNLSLNGTEPLNPQDLPRPWRRGAQILHLTPEQARAFLTEQEHLIAKYEAFSGPERYLAYFAFTPILEPACPTNPENGE